MGITLRVQSCCCGTNLRTGTTIIGTVDFIGALATVVLASIATVNSYYNNSYYHNGWEYYYYNPMNELRPMYITMAVFSSILLIFDCMLLFGVSQVKPRLMLSWIFYAFVSILLNFICAIICGDYSFSYYSDFFGYLCISWAIFYLALKIFFVLVVWSHYNQLLEGAGTTLNNGVHVTTYLTLPIGQQPFPNATQTYPNVQTQYPNVQMQHQNQPHPYPNAQQPYPNVQVQQFFPNPQQSYPNPQQPYPNSQQPYPSPEQTYPNSQQPYPNPQPFPSIESMKRDM